eukprot:138054_1
MGFNTDPCLQIHSGICANAIPSNTCNSCTMESAQICVVGQIQDNNWFYKQYAHSGCYGQYPYYYSSINNYYIYWNYDYNRWISYILLGDDTSDAVGPRNTDLFNGIGQWSVHSSINSYYIYWNYFYNRWISY